MENDWTPDIECVLESIRINCVILAKEHKKQYFVMRGTLSYFRLPVIILSSIASIVSVGLQPYLAQESISMATCLLSLICSVIGSIELYLSIQKQMEAELVSQQSFYLLGVDIYKTLSLTRDHRPIPAKEYLDKQYGEYCKLIENSHAIARKIEDKLSPLPNTLSIPASPSAKGSTTELGNLII
jgi:hypothetical protein